jgi:hypothetical protein
MSLSAGIQLLFAAEGLVKGFSENIRDLETLALLKSNPNRESELQAFSHSLCQAEMLLNDLEIAMENDLKLVQQANHVTSRFQTAKTRTRKLERKLRSKTNPEEEALVEEEEEDNTIAIVSRILVAVDQISLPSEGEFTARIPRYMRTISFEDFRRMGLFVNQAAADKSRIVLASSEALSVEEVRKRNEWKLQESMELADVMFVTVEDVMRVWDGKSTAADLRATLECLRHVGVVRLSAIHNVNRYVFLK